MNCQQICKFSRKKDLTKVKIFQNILGATFLKLPVYIKVNTNTYTAAPLSLNS